MMIELYLGNPNYGSLCSASLTKLKFFFFFFFFLHLVKFDYPTSVLNSKGSHAFFIPSFAPVI